MINNIKPDYINPLTMMKNSKQAKPLSLDALKAREKKQKALEAEKQSIQNSLLLMKGTSGNGETSEENIKLLEKKLDEITNEIKTNRQEAKCAINEKQAEEKSVMYSSFDTFILTSDMICQSTKLYSPKHSDVLARFNAREYKQKEHEESLGGYRIVNDDNKGYKIEYDELD